MNEIAIKDFKIGDVYYVEMNKTFYFFQIAKILLPTVESDNKYAIFMVALKQTFKRIPNSLEELNLSEVYIFKYIWKNYSFFCQFLEDDVHLKFDKRLMYYDLKDKYKLQFFGNATVPEKYEPELIFPPTRNFYGKSTDDCIWITPCGASSVNVFFWVLNQEDTKKNKKQKPYDALYFEYWKEFVENNHIKKIEGFLYKWQQSDKNTEAEMKKCLKSINDYEAKNGVIYTTEAEDLYQKMIDIAKEKEISEDKAINILENRMW